ncbi:hypothetical protein FPRO03_01835 [Fusarium proliferatum]|nr:hypothetical protein FPRO03_01835 [Fusarium proliferatum]
MAHNQFEEYICVTREINAPVAEVWGIIAGFGAEKAWHPGEHKGERYTFSGEMTEVDAENHSMTFRVRRPDYPDMIAYGTTVLDSPGPNKTQFRWLGNGSPLPDEYKAILQKDLNFRFNQLIDAIAAVVESK